ncbi:FkbM family methyltransferase [Mycobacterium sp. SM1]|uniref:FkbM family methyltransferase n=1 Tax=Mycobacterium sp. SM1 TaxID=2816243 RepID=UPI001BCC2937|nr:FkbM family methyltransferase [Mycobacterium sp. SM1]MBS4729544.1 FkbM family methyltransferase [Mycobacterium sp. SM1]
MSRIDAAKARGRGFLLSSMRACVAQDRLPWIAKYLYVIGCQMLLAAPDVGADETPLVSEYGTKFVAGPGRFWLHSVLRYRGVWEPALSEFILRHVQEGDVCVDVGANIGYFALLCAQREGPAGKVIAIEAAPHTAQRLRANLALNGVAGIVDVIEAACAAQQGELTFYLHPHNDGWSQLSPPTRGRYRFMMGKTWIPVTVAADTLPSIVGADAQRVSLIRLDIEGAEAAIASQIVAGFTHPRLVLALEVMPPIDATLMPFQEQGSTSMTCIMTTTGRSSARCRRSPRRPIAIFIVVPEPTCSLAGSRLPWASFTLA